MKSLEDLRKERLSEKEAPEPEKKMDVPKVEDWSRDERETPSDEEFSSDKNEEDEKKRFESELDMKILGIEDSNPINPFYKKSQKKMYTTLLMSTLLLGIILFIGWNYTSNHYSTLNEQNIEVMQRAISSSVREYYMDHGKVPADHQRNIDYNLLKKTGYLKLDVEEYHDKFILDDFHRVIRKD